MNEQIQKYYEIAAKEVAAKQVVTGLMAKAYADNNGDEKSTIATYIRLRVSQLQEQEEHRRREELQREMSRREYENPPSLMYLAGRAYGRHPILFWVVIIGAIVAVVLAIQ